MPIRFQVDPDFYDHPKTIGMSDGATALWVRAGSYSAAKLTDGFVAEHVLSLLSRCPAEASSELVERGLWRRVKGGYRFHQWSPRNLTRARVESDKQSDRQRKQLVRQNGRQNGNAQVGGHFVHPDGGPDSERSPPGIQPVSVSVSVSESVSGSGLRSDSASTALAVVDEEPPLKCDKHIRTRNPPSCGDCADARRTRSRWEAERNRRIAALPQCRIHRGQPAENCGPCRSEELSPA